MLKGQAASSLTLRLPVLGKEIADLPIKSAVSNDGD